MKTIDNTDENNLAMFSEPKTGNSLLALSYMLFSSGKPPKPAPAATASIDIPAMFQKVHVLMYCILTVLAIILLKLLL